MATNFLLKLQNLNFIIIGNTNTIEILFNTSFSHGNLYPYTRISLFLPIPTKPAGKGRYSK